jgi:hypothetical protein
MMLIATELLANKIEILIFMVFNFIMITLIFNELRNKIISVIIINNQVIKSGYLAQEKIYYFKEFDGFQTRVVKGRFKSHESLYLVKNGRKTIALSETYHQNYHELKALIFEESKKIEFSGA